MSETDPAARAFEDLCAEMTVLRRSVEALPQAWRDNRPSDYTEDLARVVKAMNVVGMQMQAIETNPTLKMMPQAYGQGIRQAGLSASQDMQTAFQKAIGEVREERQALVSIIGQYRHQEQQSWWLLGVGVSPVLASRLPSSVGTRVASFIVEEEDRWHSGSMMMAIDNPEGWQNLLWEDKLVQDNHLKIRDCRIQAIQKKSSQVCFVNVLPDDR